MWLPVYEGRPVRLARAGKPHLSHSGRSSCTPPCRVLDFPRVGEPDFSAEVKCGRLAHEGANGVVSGPAVVSGPVEAVSDRMNVLLEANDPVVANADDHRTCLGRDRPVGHDHPRGRGLDRLVGPYRRSDPPLIHP